MTRQVEKQIRDLSAYRKMASLGTKKDGVIFRDKALERVAEEYYTLCADYAEAQKAIVEKVVRIAATFTPVISDAQELIAELDVLLCFAAVALGAPEPYVRPKLVAPGMAPSGSSSRASATRASSGWRACLHQEWSRSWVASRRSRWSPA